MSILLFWVVLFCFNFYLDSFFFFFEGRKKGSEKGCVPFNFLLLWDSKLPLFAAVVFLQCTISQDADHFLTTLFSPKSWSPQNGFLASTLTLKSYPSIICRCSVTSAVCVLTEGIPSGPGSGFRTCQGFYQLHSALFPKLNLLSQRFAERQRSWLTGT